MQSLKVSKNISLYIAVSYKLVLKSVKSLTRIFSVIEYWFNALECQICSTNTNLSFWESKINLGTLEKLFPYIGVSYKFVLKSVKIESCGPWIIRSSRYNAKFGRPIQNHFSGKSRQTLELFKSFLPILGFPLKLVWSLPKP